MTRELTLTIDKVYMDERYVSGEGMVTKPMSHAAKLMEDRLYIGMDLPGELPLGTEVRVRIEVGAVGEPIEVDKSEPSRFDNEARQIQHQYETTPEGGVRARLDSQIAGIDTAVEKALKGIEERSK